MRLPCSRAWIVLLLSSWGVSAGAQVDISAWPKVRFEVRLTDANGLPVTDAGADALVVKDGGTVVKIGDLRPSSEPQSVCVLMDASSSMRGSLTAVKAAAERLLNALPAEDEVCVAEFSIQLTVDAKLTGDRAGALASLGKISAGGGTALYDSIYRLTDYMRTTAMYGSRVIVLFSDADDNYSHAGLQDVRKNSAHAGSPVIEVIRVPMKASAGSDMRKSYADGQWAKSIVGVGGGLAYMPRDVKELNAAVDGLVAAMRTRYMLSYESEVPARDGRERRVEIALDAAHRQRKDTVRVLEWYYAPTR